MRFRKKPVVIDAIPVRVVIQLMETRWRDLPEWIRDAYDNGTICGITHKEFTVKTLEGDHVAKDGDMLIRGVKGELYPCRSDIFNMTYEPEKEGEA